jgi:hypothetical protein
MYMSLWRMPDSTRSPHSTASIHSGETGRFSSVFSSSAKPLLPPLNCCGRVRPVSLMLLCTGPGQNADTPMFSGASSPRIASDSPTIPDFAIA